MVEVMKIVATSFKKVPCTNCYTQCPQLCSRPLLTHTSTGDSWTIPGKSGCGVTAPFLGSGACKVLFVPSKSLLPSPVKFWQLCGRVNGYLLQEGSRHTHICCTQSPCPLAVHC